MPAVPTAEEMKALCEAAVVTDDDAQWDLVVAAKQWVPWTIGALQQFEAFAREAHSDGKHLSVLQADIVKVLEKNEELADELDILRAENSNLHNAVSAQTFTATGLQSEVDRLRAKNDKLESLLAFAEIDVGSERVLLDVARAENTKLVALVRAAEWSGDTNYYACPWCDDGEREALAHADAAHANDCPAKSFMEGGKP